MQSAAKKTVAKPSKRARRTSSKLARRKTSAGKTADPSAGSSPSAGAPTKTDTILGLLRRKNGASVAEMVQATDWQAHSVRGFLSGTVRKKLGHTLVSKPGSDGIRRYKVVAG